jgi:hypothetical protein
MNLKLFSGTSTRYLYLDCFDKLNKCRIQVNWPGRRPSSTEISPLNENVMCCVRLRVRLRWLQVVLILSIGGSANSSPSATIFMKNAYLEGKGKIT